MFHTSLAPPVFIEVAAMEPNMDYGTTKIANMEDYGTIMELRSR